MKEIYDPIPPAEVWDRWYEEESAKIAEEEKEYQEILEQESDITYNVKEV